MSTLKCKHQHIGILNCFVQGHQIIHNTLLSSAGVGTFFFAYRVCLVKTLCNRYTIIMFLSGCGSKWESFVRLEQLFSCKDSLLYVGALHKKIMGLCL